VDDAPKWYKIVYHFLRFGRIGVPAILTLIMDPLVILKCSVQRALLGVLTNSMVGVTANIENGVVTLVIYYDGIVSDTEVELTSEIAAEVIADFPNSTIVERSLSVSTDQLKTLGFWAMLKAGYRPVI